MKTYKELQKEAEKLINKLGLEDKDVELLKFSIEYNFIMDYLEEHELEKIIYNGLKEKFKSKD